MAKKLASLGSLVLLLTLALGTPAPASVGIHLDDGTGPVLNLEIGRSLAANITGLAPGQAIDVVIRDALGWPIVTAPAIADLAGEVDITPLWIATGVVGCDCGTAVGAYRFDRLETAVLALAGTVVEVAVLDPTGAELAVTTLPLVAPSRPIGFPADATGCPRFRFHDTEDVHWSVIGGTAGAQTDVTVTSGFSGPVVEVRQHQPEGPTFLLSGQTIEVVLLWPGPDTSPGGYRVVPGGTYWPLPSDRPAGPINPGLVIDDHSCPPPTGHP